MTREEKVKKIKEKINKEANKKIDESKQILKELFSVLDDECNSIIDNCIDDIYLYKSILYWINKDTFCNEMYDFNNSYITDDMHLDIILLDSFDFCSNYIMSLFEAINYKDINQKILISIGASFNDNYIANKVVTIMDEIFYNEELKKENNNEQSD